VGRAVGWLGGTGIAIAELRAHTSIPLAQLSAAQSLAFWSSRHRRLAAVLAEITRPDVRALPGLGARLADPTRAHRSACLPCPFARQCSSHERHPTARCGRRGGARRTPLSRPCGAWPPREQARRRSAPQPRARGPRCTRRRRRGGACVATGGTAAGRESGARPAAVTPHWHTATAALAGAPFPLLLPLLSVREQFYADFLETVLEARPHALFDVATGALDRGRVLDFLRGALRQPVVRTDRVGARPSAPRCVRGAFDLTHLAARCQTSCGIRSTGKGRPSGDDAWVCRIPSTPQQGAQVLPHDARGMAGCYHEVS